MAEPGQRFWAFISYSHGDARWARWLQRALEGYPLPRRLVGHETVAGEPAPRQFKPVFRDREDLAADPDLRDSVRRALARSRYLIVLCSPGAARSPWVEDEIVQFKRLHGEARILSVIVSGEPNASDPAKECFPWALRRHLDPAGDLGDAPAEPVAADLRPKGDGRRGALLKVIAGMLGTGLDELIRRDAQRRQRELTAIAAGAVAATLVMGALTALAVAERNQAQAQRAQAEGLIEFMLGDLKDKLEPAGRLDALDAVGRRAMAYYAAQGAGGLDADSLGRRARVLHLVGSLRQKRGDLAGALGLFQQASLSTAELLARSPNDPQRIFDHAQSVFWVGHIAERRRQLEDAQAQFGAYKQLADRLVAIDPGNEAWRAEVAYADTALGDVLVKQHRSRLAASLFTEALAIFQTRAQRSPGDRDRQYELAQGHAWLADADLALGHLDDSLAQRLAERAIYASILAGAPADDAAAFSMAVNHRQVASLYLETEKPSQAEAELRAGADGAERLIAAEPDTVDYREVAASIFVLLGQSLASRDELDQARRAADQALGLADWLVRRDPTRTHWQGPVLGSARLLGIEIASAQASSVSARRAALAPAIDEAARLARLAAQAPHDRDMARIAAKAYLLAGDARSLSGRPDLAHAAWLNGLKILREMQADGVDPLDAESQALIVKFGARLNA